MYARTYVLPTYVRTRARRHGTDTLGECADLALGGPTHVRARERWSGTIFTPMLLMKRHVLRLSFWLIAWGWESCMNDH